MVIPEYIIVMTWALIAVVILAIITAILFRLYIMFLYNEKESLRDKMYKYQNQINSSKNTLYSLKREIEELEIKRDKLQKKS